MVTRSAQRECREQCEAEIMGKMNLVINKHEQVSDKQNKVRDNSREEFLLKCLLEKSLFGKNLFVNKQRITNLTYYYENS